MLYEYNLGIRDYITTTDAMLNNSLFYYYMLKNGLNVYKGESTRDLICLDFDFGSKSYEEEIKRMTKLKDSKEDEETKKKFEYALDNINKNKDLYNKKSRDEIRKEYYENGVDVTYDTKNKDGTIKSSETIHYVMLFRTPAKAKLGQVVFINENLYDAAYDWLTIGIGKKMPKENAKIIEMSAYAPLTTSTIVDTVTIPVDDILILNDQDSFFKTMTNVVSAIDTGKFDDDGNPIKKCIVTQEEREVKNTIWDGMGLIESSILDEPETHINGMALLRNHMFKMCGIRTYIQKFFKEWCEENNHDYETYEVKDMFGVCHKLKDVKIITTKNSIKWVKFSDLMGETPRDAYKYWCERIKDDNNVWGIVKTDHPSKLGENQQMSYQMVNTLPCTKEEVRELADTSISYVEKLKHDDDEFEKFLRKNVNEINHYEMLADLYAHNKNIAGTAWFRNEKSYVIKTYVNKLRNGKINIHGDNLTVFGNPYALLLHSVGEDYLKDPCFKKEEGTIQCYTSRFANGEYLCAIRNPHNSPENISYLHNIYNNIFIKYFNLSKNIMIVNCIETDIQDRMNGEDFDSDFNFVTNNPVMVKSAKYAYENYHTIVNALKESGLSYTNEKASYAEMDSKFSKSKLGIGWSSNLAQLAMTYYWTELEKENPDEELIKELHDNVIILAVLAQIIIDSCKRSYEVDGMTEIKRIQALPCMTKKKIITEEDENGIITKKEIRNDFPEFMKYTRQISLTKNGKPREYDDITKDKDRLNSRINYDLTCPMNYLEEYLGKIQGMSKYTTVPISDFFIKCKEGHLDREQINIVIEHIIEFEKRIRDIKVKYEFGDPEMYSQKISEAVEILNNQMSRMKRTSYKTINRMVEVALDINTESYRAKRKYDVKKYSRKILNTVYKWNKERFLSCFLGDSE